MIITMLEFVKFYDCASREYLISFVLLVRAIERVEDTISVNILISNDETRCIHWLGRIKIRAREVACELSTPLCV